MDTTTRTAVGTYEFGTVEGADAPVVVNQQVATTSINMTSAPTVLDAAGLSIVITLPQRLLFHYVDGGLRAHYPIAVGLSDWQTPLGPFTIIEKEEDPTWDVPESIQEEMRLEGKRVLTKVPPGPDNPLGRHWLRLSFSGVGLHGTNVPSSVYRGTISTSGFIPGFSGAGALLPSLPVYDPRALYAHPARPRVGEREACSAPWEIRARSRVAEAGMPDGVVKDRR